MLKPDERILKALNNIQQYPDWKIIREWIDGSMTSKLISSAISRNDVVSRWYQGAAQELLDIQSHFDNAGKSLDRMDNAKEQRHEII